MQLERDTLIVAASGVSKLALHKNVFLLTRGTSCWETLVTVLAIRRVRLWMVVALGVSLGGNLFGGDCNPSGPGRCYAVGAMNLVCNGQTVPAPAGTEVAVSWWTDWFCIPGRYYSFGVDNFVIGGGAVFSCHGLGGMDTYVDAILATATSGGSTRTYSGAYTDYGGTVNLVCDGGSQTTPGPEYTKRCDRKSGGDGACESCDPQGMARYTAHSMLASLNIEDTPFRYIPPRGPAIEFTVTYNQRETQHPTTFTYSNLGPKWTLNWLSYVTDNPANATADATVYIRGGGTESYTGFNSDTQSYAPDRQSLAVLVRTSGLTYEKRFPDGSKEIFGPISDGSTSYPRRIFLTSVIDPAGNAVTLTYEAGLRISAITDSLGQSTTLSYDLPEDSLKVTKVTDPFGRFATFDYTSGKLTKITDPIGIQSQFTYTTGTDFINSMTTPYGTRTFATGDSGTNKWIEMTDPLGGKERVEFRDLAPGISPIESVAPGGMTNSGLNRANTYYWDKKATEMYPPVNGVYDYTKARVTHWQYNVDGAVAGIAASEKAPLENRVWYAYAGQSDTNHAGSSARPNKIARLLGDGSTHLWQFDYNSIGKVTKAIDPVGRATSYVYDTNNIDLLTVYQRNPNGASTDPSGAAADKIASYTYNAFHEPLTETDAAVQTTSYTYNSFGQVLTRTNAKNQTTTFAYGGSVPDGYLGSITSPPFNNASAVTTFTYDSANRVRTVTDSDGYTVTTDYDNLDRPSQITYPDGTTQQFQYSQDFGQGATTILDLTRSKDRRGLWTTRHYNANRQMDSITDRQDRTTLFGWCNCGALATITDPKNQTTTFNRDLQGRVYQKVFADNTAINYLYDGQNAPNTTGATSRLKSMTDAKNQVTNYEYFVDNDLKQISYTNTSGQQLSPPTPTVTFTYDPNYNRVRTMADGTGTTTYAYLAITGSVSPGAGQLQSVDGPLANDSITYTYDELGRELSHAVNGVSASQTYDLLGRISTVTNPLGLFSNSYVSVSNRLQSTLLPNGQSNVYSYLGNSSDKRLQTIQNNMSGGALLSKFDYVYDADGEITQWKREFATSNPIQWDNGSNPMGDLADQLTSVIERDAVTQALLTSYSYAYDSAGNRISDNAGTYTINNVNQITSTGYTYDNNGNLTADPSRTYEWDAANRLTAINYTAIGARSEFTYDGLGRRVKIVELTTGISLTVQPANTQYTLFSAGPVILSAGAYTLKFEGLNPNGGDNTVFIDAVKLNGTVVPNGGFEAPSTGSYIYAPAPTAWSYQSNAGVTTNGSGFTSGNPNAPDGSQVAFIQQTGSASQVLSLAGGAYTLTFYAAQRGNYQSSYQQVRASLLDGAQTPAISLTVQPTNTQYTLFSSGTVTLSAGAYTVKFEGLNPNGGDNTVFIDAVKLNGTVVPNGGFEAPSTGSYIYAPAPTVWSYQSNAGVTTNGSGFTSGNPNAPDGSQVGFIQQTGNASQVLSLAGGAYTLTFYAAQRGNYNASYQRIQFSLQSAIPSTSTKRFIWIGNRIAEERDANNNVTRRFYAEGEQTSGNSYYYTRDHLGSVRELTDSSGAIRARYDYDPYGVRTKLSGDLDASFGYTGHYYHQPSGLNLALYRAYDPGTGRWLSQDPIGEAGGLNLYGYVKNNPIKLIDPLGLDSYLLTFGPDQKGIPHTAVWIVDSRGSTFYSFDSGGLHRISNPSSFIADEGLEKRSLLIDQLDPTRVSDEALRDYYEHQIADDIRYGERGQVCNTQARDAIESATLQSDAPYVPTDSAFTPGFLRLDLIRQDFIDPSQVFRLGRPDQ